MSNGSHCSHFALLEAPINVSIDVYSTFKGEKRNKKATLKISANKIIYLTKPTQRFSSAPCTDLPY